MSGSGAGLARAISALGLARTVWRRSVWTEDTGAVGNGVTDDTAAFRAAENGYVLQRYNARPTGTVGCPPISLDARVYMLNTFAKATDWVGLGPLRSVIKYNGAAGVDWITQANGSGPGRQNVGLLGDLTLNGNGCGTIFSITEVDALYTIENVSFSGGTTCLKINGWINCHMRGGRMDGPGDCALLLVGNGSNTSCSFSWSGFTIDSSTGPVTNPTALVRIDLSGVGSSNIGEIKFSDARIELNTNPMAGNKAVFEIKAPGSNRCHIILDSISVQCDVAGRAAFLFYNVNGGALATQRISVRGLTMPGWDPIGLTGTQLFGGDFPAWMLAIPSGNWLWFEVDGTNGFVGQRQPSVTATGALEMYGPNINTDMQQMRGLTDVFPRISIRPNSITGGDGTVAPAILVNANGAPGWSVPTGTLSRAAFATGAATGSSASYVQTEANAALARIASLEQHVAALVTDLHITGATHGLLRT